ncbi:hypothetical protein [Bradyrhizobium cytisi]|uniref:Uncharacterized protein n=1 Tax=Bradyrhizobium cytisi TaxID=515489 RepID=A0A5S4WXF6_9BRAD|nr:hypothetical protein [Bradyrhizobium cytisi]TYL86774.1 hypothetical protein FXB38_05810 [Bradyrhizobium cytisi]
MIKSLVTAVLASILDIAWPMCRSRENAVIAQSDTAARLWVAMGRTGKTMEALVDHVAARCGIDIAQHMIDREYGR